ncbi:hypothetical protein D917_06464 [Trichinella nativa]|uniref:Uncharacterized protein n=1 Tax=Trichinella nativa TaxID=6335 RepID=A0A1Y3EY95_9BILA|nr:hypothetical protein D917_06464 [Trichinella nativa]
MYRSGQTRTTKKFEKGSLKFVIVTYRSTEPKMFYFFYSFLEKTSKLIVGSLAYVVNSSISLNVKQLLEQIGGEEAVFERLQLIHATWLFTSSALL